MKRSLTMAVMPVLSCVILLLSVNGARAAMPAAAALGLDSAEAAQLYLPAPVAAPAFPAMGPRFAKGAFQDFLDALERLTAALGELAALVDQLQKQGLELDLYDPASFTLSGARAALKQELPMKWGYLHSNLTGAKETARTVAANPAWLGEKETRLLTELLTGLDKDGSLTAVVARVQLWAAPGCPERNYFFDIYLNNGLLLKLHYRLGAQPAA